MERTTDEEAPASCLPCRLISGSVLIGCGFYIGYHASKLKKGKNAALLIATGINETEDLLEVMQ
ncbi:unnamed protein product [Bemisia tabaci]|uniref:Distal membrane-arm assembly complex protein 1-like domain-containing protein n=1 Tax=Bemisia tabaci TaxID=7038 RepID=A0A9P0A643_BEMTA|nr:unnamed protein product [Bemisia tabaci]